MNVNKMFSIVLSFTFLASLVACQQTESKEQERSENEQKIEILSSKGVVENTITSDKKIDEFIDALQMDDWSLSDQPQLSERFKEFKLYTPKTKTLLNVGSSQDNLSNASIIIYENSSIITFVSTFIELDFEIPSNAIDAVLDMLQE
ncbi:ABC transporter substrate-binding protein [Bacillus sp. TS-2]|nr:ABC transporter substrate-binding protein [Bacillus sp. TS-2]